jgi:ATP-dependent Clp endopeptidase proteolytic subunit ClpP
MAKPKRSDEQALKDLERRKLELEVAKLEAEVRQTEAVALEAEVDAARARHGWETRQEAYRSYHFNAEINGSSVAGCISWLDHLARIDPSAPIEVIFNSPGGTVIDGLQLYDHILGLRAGGTPINTTVLGMGASMAGVLSQAGERRRMGRRAYLMIHEVASLNIGKVSELKDRVKVSERLYDTLLGILSSRSNLTVEEIRERADRKDWWIDAQEARELGLVDEVVPEPAIEAAA